MADHIRIMQEQLEYRLSYLDSSNIAEIDTGQTKIITLGGYEINIAIGSLWNDIENVGGNLENLQNGLVSTNNRFTSTIADMEGNISRIDQTAGQIALLVADNQGAIADLVVRADSIAATVSNQAGDISQLRQTATDITSTVASHTGDISQLKQTATSLTSTIESHTGDISQLKQTATSLTSTVSSHTGDISQLQQTATSLSSTIQSHTGQISQINQTQSSLSLTVSNMQTNNATMLRITDQGVIVTNQSGASVTIQGSQINAGSLNLTGHIAFSDFTSSLQTQINSAASAGANASLAIAQVEQIANGMFQGGTFINGKNIYSPRIYGDTISLLDGNSNLVGTMSLVYSSTYAFDITSNLSLRLNASPGYNSYIGVLNGPYVACRGDLGTITLGNAGLLLSENRSFGTSLPSTAQYGQVFFKVGNNINI